jgi:predicted glycosyl hydrolase (DUF1957 family)
VVKRSAVTESWLQTVEQQDNIFPNIDYRLYGT